MPLNAEAETDDEPVLVNMFPVPNIFTSSLAYSLALFISILFISSSDKSVKCSVEFVGATLHKAIAAKTFMGIFLVPYESKLSMKYHSMSLNSIIIFVITKWERTPPRGEVRNL